MAAQGRAVTLGDAGRRSAFSPVLRPAEHLDARGAGASAALPYEAGIETLMVDEEEEDDIIEITSTFPLGQCSRTSPGNHATIRRWRQRSSRLVTRAPRTHSAAGYTRPMEVLVSAADGDPGPLSAPSSVPWARTSFSPLATSPYPPSPIDQALRGATFSPLPAAASTPLVVPQPKFPFNISSIVATTASESPRRADKVRGREGREPIPVGIAVARQRQTDLAKVSLTPQRRPEGLVSETKPEPVRPDASVGFPPSGYPGYPYPLPWAYPHPYLLPQGGPMDYLYLQQQLLMLHQVQKDCLPAGYTAGAYPLPMPLPTVPLTYPWPEVITPNPPKVVDASQKPFNLSLPTDDSGLEMSTESNNNLTKETSGGACDSGWDHTTASPGEGREVLREASPRDDLVIDMGSEEVRDEVRDEVREEVREVSSEGMREKVEEGVMEEKGSLTSESEGEASETAATKTSPVIKEKEEEGDIGEGLLLLTEGIACMEELGQMKSAVDCLGEMKLKTMRHLSVDSYHHKKYDSLQLLCDVASSVQKGEVGPRGVRSKSLDVGSARRLAEMADSNRNHRSPRAEQDVKEFISKKTNTYQRDRSSSQEPDTKKSAAVGGGGRVLPNWSTDPSNMEAWELDIRIRMAEKQRRYTEITRKLKRLQSLKSKKSDSPRKKDTPKKGELLQKCDSQQKHELPHKPDQRKREQKLGEPAAKSAGAAEQVPAGIKTIQPVHPVQDKIVENATKEIFSPEKPPIDKASSFTDAFHKFKKAYNAKKSGSDTESKTSTPLSCPSKASFSPILTPKSTSILPFSNWARIANESSPSFTAVKEEPTSDPPVRIKSEPVDEAPIAEPQQFYLEHPIKKEPVSGCNIDRKRNSEDSNGHMKVLNPLLHARKKPKLEKFVVSEVMKSPRKKSTEQEDCWREKKKQKKDRKRSQEKTWKVVSSFDWDHESNLSDSGNHKKLDVVLTQSKATKPLTAEDNSLGKSDKKIKLEENQSDREESPIKERKAERETSSKPHKHKKEKKHKKDHHRDSENPHDREERRRRKKEKKIKKETQIKVKHEMADAFAVKREPGSDLGQSCVLVGSHLKDGLRILKRIGAHFYPGRVTEISPPDIYGILVDGERGNKPHIASREEVLQEAVLDVRPEVASDLPVGARVCAYWSSKIPYLHPGTVAAPDIDSNYVIVELDDGDSRDIHIKDIRFLPPSYPHVDKEDDQIAAILGGRRRSNPSANTTPVKTKKARKSSGSPKAKAEEWSVSVTELPSSSLSASLKASPSLPDLSQLPGIKVETERDDDQDSAFVSNGAGGDCDSDFEDVDKPHQRRVSGSDKSKIAAFLPPRHLLWAWADVGRKLSPKARKLFHQKISKEEETIAVGDCAVFLSTGRPDRPYIGRVQAMWESWGGHMKVQVKWFYHAAETEGTAKGGGRVEDITVPGALFESSHYDENDVQTISHKCEVVEFPEVEERRARGAKAEVEEEQVYYLAGQYDPVVGSIVFSPTLFK